MLYALTDDMFETFKINIFLLPLRYIITLVVRTMHKERSGLNIKDEQLPFLSLLIYLYIVDTKFFAHSDTVSFNNRTDLFLFSLLLLNVLGTYLPFSSVM
ncbi:hypothetical protein EGW08_018183 [Elysia chlorotica]|uniref:Uncharacterized protein n=1 Tax=Elysia chlorotica TaxID=188477 RepID=A0A433SXL2_ELYCH|nr:hypothetical protein EGW08_018183 [Elysia chlorotica]